MRKMNKQLFYMYIEYKIWKVYIVSMTNLSRLLSILLLDNVVTVELRTVEMESEVYKKTYFVKSV